MLSTAAGPVVLGYYPSWTTDVTPDEIDYRPFTHLAHAFVTVGGDGTLVTDERIPGRDLCERAHRAKVKVLLAVGGADSNPTLTRAMSRPDAAARLVTPLVEMVARHGYDGIDVDWEFPASEEDARRMNDFVRRVRAELDRRVPGALLTMAVPASDWNGRWFERDALLPHVDWVNVMTYDFHGPWSDHAGHNAPLYAVKNDAKDGALLHFGAALTYWTRTKRWPREKLLLGVPAYGRGFAVSRWHETPTGTAAHPYLAYRDVAGLLAAGWARRWDNEARVPFLEKPGGGELISYEDEASAALKGAWIRRQRVRGLFFWEVTQDFLGGTHRLVRAARGAFLGATGGPEGGARRP